MFSRDVMAAIHTYTYTYIHTYIHTYTLLSIPEKALSASILKILKQINNLITIYLHTTYILLDYYMQTTIIIKDHSCYKSVH